MFTLSKQRFHENRAGQVQKTAIVGYFKEHLCFLSPTRDHLPMYMQKPKLISGIKTSTTPNNV